MFKLVDVPREDFFKVIYSAKWLENDNIEAILLTGMPIYSIFKKSLIDDPVYKVIYTNDKLITAIAIDCNNNMTYYNTEDVKPVLKSYFKFLKKILNEYVEENNSLYITTHKSYTTALKKNKLVGFKPLEYYKDRIVYGKQKEDL